MSNSIEASLLDEVRSEYTRQLQTWTELIGRSHQFLQINGLILTIVLIGMQLTINSGNSIALIFLLMSAVLIVLSMLIVLLYVAKREIIKEIRIDIKEGYDASGKDKEILLALINTYNTAQNDLIEKYNKRSRDFQGALWCLLAALVSLAIFISLITLTVIQ